AGPNAGIVQEGRGRDREAHEDRVVPWDRAREAVGDEAQRTPIVAAELELADRSGGPADVVDLDVDLDVPGVEADDARVGPQWACRLARAAEPTEDHDEHDEHDEHD